jgi:hypothetical protein
MENMVNNTQEINEVESLVDSLLEKYISLTKIEEE